MNSSKEYKFKQIKTTNILDIVPKFTVTKLIYNFSPALWGAKTLPGLEVKPQTNFKLFR